MVLDGLPRAEAVAGGGLALAGPTTAAAGFVRRRRGPGQYKPCPALAETRLVSSTPTAERPAARSSASTGRWDSVFDAHARFGSARAGPQRSGEIIVYTFTAVFQHVHGQRAAIYGCPHGKGLVPAHARRRDD